MSLPQKAVTRNSPSPAEDASSWPFAQDAQTRKPPQRSSLPHDRSEDARNGVAENAENHQERSFSEVSKSVEDGQSEPSTTALRDRDQRNGINRVAYASAGPQDGVHQQTNIGRDSKLAVLDFPIRERLLNAREVADRLGVSERWVRDHTTRRSPKIRALKLGTLIRYRPSDVDTFMDHLDTLRPSGDSRFRV